MWKTLGSSVEGFRLGLRTVTVHRALKVMVVDW